MARLSQADLAGLLDFTRRLYAVTDAEVLPRWLVRHISDLVGADHVTWNDMAFSVPWVDIMEYPTLPRFDSRNQVFSRHVLQHPGVQHFLSTGDPDPVKISDFLTAAEFRRLPVYDVLYRELRYEDQLGLCLSPPGPQTRAVALARDRRNFRERDREVLRIIRPHLAQAYANADALRRARVGAAEVEADGPAAGVAALAVVRVDADARLTGPVHHARRIFRRFFELEPHRSGDLLPEPLARWVRDVWQRAAEADAAFDRPLRIRRQGRQLIVRAMPAMPGPALLLVVEERTDAAVLRRLAADRLTTRELQVLRQVEQGKTNREVAAALFISPRTVQKHLENIFEKLGVTTRTAALAALRGRQQRRRSSI